MLNIGVKRIPVLFIFILFCVHVVGQDNNVLLKEAQTLEQKFDEAGALEKYKQLAANDASNIKALVKCVELNCSIGSRQKDKTAKANHFDSAQFFAQQAYAKDSLNADACYAMALVASKMNELDPDNKKIVENIRQIKIYADKALANNVNHAQANYLLGKWHFELIRSGWLKKNGVKNFYNAIPDTQVDSAAYYMEKARSIEPYFALDYLDLAKVYAYDHQPGKAIDVLNKLVKLPNRTFDDPAIKEEGKQMLAQME